MKKVLVPFDSDNKEKFVPPSKEVNLNEWLKQFLKKVDMENRTEELQRHKKWAINRAFYRGNQRGFWDNKKQTWVSVDVDTLSPSEASILVVNNQFRPQVKTLAKEFSRSQARVRATPISDSQEAIHTSRFSDALVKFYQARLMPETTRQLEAKYLMLCGNSFRYTYYDPKKKGVIVPVRVHQSTLLPAYEDDVCVDCGHDVPDEEGQCAECGGEMEHTQISPEESIGQSTTLMDSGDVVTEIVDPVEIKVWAGAKSGLDQSPYLRRKRLVRKEFIKNAYPWYNNKQSNSLSDSAIGLFQFLDTSDSPGRIEGEMNLAELSEYDQIWLEPSTYQGLSLKDPVELLNGDTFGKGTLITDIFPTGLYACFCDSDVLGYAKESKKDVWVHIPYDINIDGFWADGLEDSVRNQQIINEYTSLSVENVLYNAAPKLVLNDAKVNPNNMTGRPKDALVYNDPKSESRWSDHIGQLSGMSLTPDVMMGIESSKRDMREQTGALVGFNGQGDPSLTTATAISIARDSALALVSTPLAIRAEKDLEWSWQILKHVKKNWFDQKYKFLLGKYSDEEAESFKAAKLDTAIFLSVEANSWMPVTQYEKLQNLGAYLTAFNIPMGFLNPQIPQAVRDYASQLYNVPFEFNELAPDIRIAQRRIEKAKEAAAQLIPQLMIRSGVIASTMEGKAAAITIESAEQSVITAISDVMGVEEDIDIHEIFVATYLSWLKTDEGQSANPILRNAIKSTIADHRNFMNEAAEAARAKAMEMSQNGPQPTPAGQGGSAPFSAEDVADSPFSPPKNGKMGGMA